MINVNLTQLPAISADEAYMLTGAPAADFNQPGIYNILIGSRGEVEEFNFLGNVDSVEVPSLEDLLANVEEDFERDMYEEFYGIGIEEDHINFGYTEEGYDVFLRI
jgi:hypothetical protein